MKYEVLSFDPSRKNSKPYIVECDDQGKSWTCTCPHWQYRLAKSKTRCKHIDKVIEDNERNERIQREIAAQFEHGYGFDMDDDTPPKPDDPEMQTASAI